MSAHDVGVFGLGLFLGYQLYIALNYREVRRSRILGGDGS